MAVLLFVSLACPVFYLMNLKSTWAVCAGYFLLSLGLALYACCLPVVIVNQVRIGLCALLFASCHECVLQFSVKYRYTSLGIGMVVLVSASCALQYTLIFLIVLWTAYNVANAIFAGTAPLIQTSLVLHVHTSSVRSRFFTREGPANAQVYVCFVRLLLIRQSFLRFCLFSLASSLS